MNFEVTDDDLLDPDIAATLQALGWDEESNQPDDIVPQLDSVKRDKLKDEILKLKKEALTQKRYGNTTEAMSLLKKAKVLGKDLEILNDVNTRSLESELVSKMDRKLAPKNKITIQKELLSLKKKALALRKEGKLEEADNELKKGKVLEQQLEEMDNNTSNVRALMNVSHKTPLDNDVSPSVSPENQKSLVQQEILSHKRKALIFKREGKLAEALEKPRNSSHPETLKIQPYKINPRVIELGWRHKIRLSQVRN